jgi:hypothetical protein
VGSPRDLGVRHNQFHHGKNVQIHSKFSETHNELGCNLV